MLKTITAFYYMRRSAPNPGPSFYIVDVPNRTGLYSAVRQLNRWHYDHVSDEERLTTGFFADGRRLVFTFQFRTHNFFWAAKQLLWALKFVYEDDGLEYELEYQAGEGKWHTLRNDGNDPKYRRITSDASFTTRAPRYKAAFDAGQWMLPIDPGGAPPPSVS